MSIYQDQLFLFNQKLQKLDGLFRSLNSQIVRLLTLRIDNDLELSTDSKNALSFKSQEIEEVINQVLKDCDSLVPTKPTRKTLEAFLSRLESTSMEMDKPWYIMTSSYFHEIRDTFFIEFWRHDLLGQFENFEYQFRLIYIDYSKAEQFKKLLYEVFTDPLIFQVYSLTRLKNTLHELVKEEAKFEAKMILRHYLNCVEKSIWQSELVYLYGEAKKEFTLRSMPKEAGKIFHGSADFAGARKWIKANLSTIWRSMSSQNLDCDIKHSSKFNDKNRIILNETEGFGIKDSINIDALYNGLKELGFIKCSKSDLLMVLDDKNLNGIKIDWIGKTNRLALLIDSLFGRLINPWDRSTKIFRINGKPIRNLRGDFNNASPPSKAKDWNELKELLDRVNK